MSKIIVTFTPEGTRTEASPGEKLINIASYADIDISNMCGGLGVCGKCRVKVNKGKVNLSSRVISMLSRKELEQGYVFACQAESQDEDLEIWIPSASRRELHQIQVADYLVAYDQPTQVEGTPDLPTIRCSCPLCRKYYLDLPYPTVHDSISDLDRVYRELKKLPELTNIKARSSVLAGLGDLVRKSNWKVTATVHFGDSDCPCISYLEPGDTTSANFGVAIDVGTTTIVAQLMNLATGKSAGVQASHNSQARYGEDVISRMVYACSHDGLTPLTEAVVHTINSLIQSLVLKSGITHDQITCFVAAGNTVMSHLLLGLNPANIRNEPYIPVASNFPRFQAAEAGLRGHPRSVLYCMPCVSSYVGGDITAGVMACGMNDQSRVSALFDIGTNGEIVIGNNEWLVCCASSAGPAFEGGGITSGVRAIRGAIDKIRLNGEEVFYQTIGKDKPVGLCGSAIIDIIAELLMKGIIDQSGKFLDLSHSRVRIADEVPEFIIAYPEETDTGEAIVITEDDISNLIKSKGAVLASAKVLLNSMGMSFSDLWQINVAGGFGSHLDIEKAIFIGLLPDIPRDGIRFIGNSSLAGARLALMSKQAFQEACSTAGRMTYFELSVNRTFMDEFVASLFLPHTQMSLFPSVKEALKNSAQLKKQGGSC